jgi:hypothetical protein
VVPVIEHVTVVQERAIEVDGAEVILTLLLLDELEELADRLAGGEHDEEHFVVVADTVGHAELGGHLENEWQPFGPSADHRNGAALWPTKLSASKGYQAKNYLSLNSPKDNGRMDVTKKDRIDSSASLSSAKTLSGDQLQNSK